MQYFIDIKYINKIAYTLKKLFLGSKEVGLIVDKLFIASGFLPTV